MQKIDEKFYTASSYVSNPLVQPIDDSDKDVTKVSVSLVENLFELGLSSEAIEERILSYYDIELDNEEAQEISELIQDIEERIEEEQQSSPEEPTDVSEIIQEEVSAVNEQNDLELSPIDETTDETWNIEDNLTLFSDGISKEDFMLEFDILNAFENEQALEEQSDFIKSISKIGSDKFFDELDVDLDGTLSEEEILALFGADDDITSISANEFNNVFNKIVEKYPELKEIVEQNALNETEEVQQAVEQQASAPVKKSGSSGSSGSYSSSGSSSSSSGKLPDVPKEPTVQELMQERTKIEQEANTKIQEVEAQKAEFISQLTIDETLKTNYQTAQKNYDDNEKSLDDAIKAISDTDNSIHTVETQLASITGELSTLKTDTDNPEINQANTERRNLLISQQAELQKKKEDLEADKLTQEETKVQLETQQTELKLALDEAYNAMYQALDATQKAQLDSFDQQIQSLETEKAQKLQEIDAKIETAIAREVQEAQQSGETMGSLASNEFGASVIKNALKYEGMTESTGALEKFSTGNYGWCADFVTYVVKETARQMGKSEAEIKEIDKHLGASPYKLRSRNEGHYYLTSDIPASEYQTTIQPGMAFICKGSGASGEHTGLVVEVYADGTFLTIEGNSNNMVRSQRRNISDMYGFVDFSYLM